MILGNRDFFACDFPYNLAVREGLLSRKRVLQERLDPNYNEITWMMEMDSLFFQGTTSSLYSFEDTEAARKIDFAFYPPEISGMISDKRVKIPQKMHNERRIMSVDVALMASSSTADNDATSIDINHMVMGTSLGSAVNNIVYRVSNEGYTTDEEALLIRRLFNQYACDWLVIDARGIGLGVLDKLLCDIYDPTNGMVYGALSCYNDPAIAARCKVKTAPKVIWAINATAQFNSQIALGLREALRSGKIRLLKSEEDFDEYANTLAGYAKLTPEQRQLFRLPHINTTLGNAELISLEYETRDSGVKVHERSGRRKDRYSSLAYNIEVAKAVERNYFEKQSNAAGFSAVVARFRQPQIYNHSGKGVNII